MGAAGGGFVDCCAHCVYQVGLVILRKRKKCIALPPVALTAANLNRCNSCRMRFCSCFEQWLCSKDADFKGPPSFFCSARLAILRQALTVSGDVQGISSVTASVLYDPLTLSRGCGSTHCWIKAGAAANRPILPPTRCFFSKQQTRPQPKKAIQKAARTHSGSPRDAAPECASCIRHAFSPRELLSLDQVGCIVHSHWARTRVWPTAHSSTDDMEVYVCRAAADKGTAAAGALACCKLLLMSCRRDGVMRDENQELPMMLQQTQAGVSPHTNTHTHTQATHSYKTIASALQAPS